MTSRTYRNREFQIIAQRVERDDGRVELREPDGSILGWYDPDTDETREPDGTIIGHGDILATLLEDAGTDEEHDDSDDDPFDSDFGDDDDFEDDDCNDD